MRDGLGRRAARRIATLGQRQHRSPARCRYAQILDGEHLWLSVVGPFADSSRVVLYDESAGEATAVDADVERTEEGVALSARIALTGPDAPRRFGPGDEVLLAVEEPGGRHPIEVDDGVTPAAPSRVPTIVDNTLHFSLKRGRSGALRLSCAEVPPAALVHGLGQTEDAFDVCVRLPRSVDAADVVLSDDDGAEVHRVPVDLSDDATITLPLRRMSLPMGRFTLSIDAGGKQWPVMRARNGLRVPQQAVVLPVLVLDDGSDSLTRFGLVYGRAGQLALSVRAVDDES